MSVHTTPSVRRQVTVGLAPPEAFELFTTGMAAWWPRESHHIGDQDAEAVLEPRAGGRWFERDAEGGECDWGFVTAWEPPGRVLLAWHLTPEWDFDPDPARATEVEVTFTPSGDGTLVELEHRGFEKHGAPGAKMRESVSSAGGWQELLDLFGDPLQA